MIDNYLGEIYQKLYAPSSSKSLLNDFHSAMSSPSSQVPSSQVPPSQVSSTSATKHFDLLGLPLELFNHVVSFLGSYDIRSLEMTCRTTAALLPYTLRPNPSYLTVGYFELNRPNSRPFFLMPYWQMHEHLEFMDRLFTPGNIFHNKDVDLCIRCLRVRFCSKFPLKDFRCDGYRVCEDCVVLSMRGYMPPGHHHEWKNMFVYSCRHCGWVLQEHNAYEHRVPRAIFSTREHERLCKHCHLACRQTKYCEGWDYSEIYMNSRHFTDLEQEVDTSNDEDNNGDQFVPKQPFVDELNALFNDDAGIDTSGYAFVNEDTSLSSFITEPLEDDNYFVGEEKSAVWSRWKWFTGY